VRAHFSADIMAARYERVYHQAIAEHFNSLMSMPVSDAGGLTAAGGLSAAGGASAGTGVVLN
jgi:hypothetical protein